MKTIIKFTLIIVMSMLTISTYAQKPSAKHYLSISHEVSDYNSWKVVFDKFNIDRVEAGIIDLFVKKNINNTNSITVFSKITDLKKAQIFMSSPTLKEAMKNAGVTSPPIIVFYKSANEYDLINTSSLITTITHSVKDYSTWKNVYESAEQMRKQEGIIDHVVLKSLIDENVITILGSSTSADSFNKFMASPSLKTAMGKAGVTSKPEVKIIL